MAKSARKLDIQPPCPLWHYKTLGKSRGAARRSWKKSPEDTPAHAGGGVSAAKLSTPLRADAVFQFPDAKGGKQQAAAAHQGRSRSFRLPWGGNGGIFHW